MKTYPLFLFLLLTASAFPQNLDLHSNENKKKFADHLFCEKDYLRSIFEYESVLQSAKDDSIKFKIGLAYQRLGEYQESMNIFSSLMPGKDAENEFYHSLFLMNDFKKFRNSLNSSREEVNPSVNKLYMFSYFFTDETLPTIEKFYQTFPGEKAVESFYRQKINPGYKSEITAVVLSALIPGAGKIYTGQYGDGITAFIATGLLAYLSYSNFNNDHDFRGWLFGSAAAVFYAGNIYGSAASAKIFNAGIKLNFESELRFFLDQNNYFMNDYNFCR